MNKRKKLLLLCLAGSLTAILPTPSGTLARYTTTVSGSDCATAAIAELSVSELQFAVQSMIPGSSQTISFFVTNMTDSASEVTLDYTISVTSTQNLPLIFTLACTNASAGTGITEQASAQNVWTGGMLPGGIEAVHQYTLTLQWPASSNSAALADEIDLITVTVQAE